MPQLDRIALTEQQVRATEIALYHMADLINRLLADGGVPYTKMPHPAAVPYQQPQMQPQLAPKGWAYGGETAVSGGQ